MLCGQRMLKSRYAENGKKIAGQRIVIELDGD